MIETLLLLLIVRLRSGGMLDPTNYSFYDSWQSGGETRFGPRVWTAVAALLLLALACLYIRPALHPMAMGQLYADLSRSPFTAADSPVSFRFLTPLISYVLWLRGDLILVTNLLFAGLLLAMVHWHFRKNFSRPGDAMVAPLTLTYSLVTLTTVFHGGYCDSLTYVLLFASWVLRRRAVAFYLAFFLSLLNREAILFLVPWLALIRIQVAGARIRTGAELVLGFVLTVGLYLWIRQLISQSHEVDLTFTHYLAPLLQDPFHWMRDSVRFWWVGLFSVFKILWLIPVLAGISAWRSGKRSLVYSMGLLLACSFSQLAVGFDTSRMLTMAFPVMILALEHLFRESGDEFRRWIPKLLIVNLFIPQLFTAADVIEVTHSPLTTILLNLFGLPR
jgi:hypothetical protein